MYFLYMESSLCASKHAKCFTFIFFVTFHNNVCNTPMTIPTFANEGSLDIIAFQVEVSGERQGKNHCN